MNETVKFVLALLAVLFLMAASYIEGTRLQPPPMSSPAIQGTQPVITLERLGQIVTTRVHVTDVLIAEGEGHRGSWLIKGDALLSCDMSQARISAINGDERTATICLPPLRVVSARVDHSQTRTWSVEKVTWLPWKWGDQDLMRDSAMKHAQYLVEDAATAEGTGTSSRDHAALLIRQTFELIGWKVDVKWQ